MSVIEGVTNVVVGDPISVGNSPSAAAVNQVTGQVYIGNYSDNTVSVIDGASNTVAATISVGQTPFGMAVNPATGHVYVANENSNNVSVIDGQGTQGVPIGIATQGATTTPSPYIRSAATANLPYITTYPDPSFTAIATSSYAGSVAYSMLTVVNPPLTALYYWLDDGSMSSWQSAAPSSTTGSNPATFPIALSGKKPGFYLLYMFAAYGNEGTPWNFGNGGNSPEISEVTAYPFYISPIATTTVVQADVNP